MNVGQDLDQYEFLEFVSVGPEHGNYELMSGEDGQEPKKSDDGDWVRGLFNTDVDKSMTMDRSEKHVSAVDGGVDIKGIVIEKQILGEKIRFNEKAIKSIFNEGFSGFIPVIINIAPVQSPLMMMGVEGK